MTPIRSLVPTCAIALLSAPIAAQNFGAAFDPNVDGYIEVPYSAQVVPQSGITVEAWITYDETMLGGGYRYPTIVRQGLVGPSPTENYLLRIDADNFNQRELRWLVITTSGTITVNYLFAAGEFVPWTHVAGTYDGATAALYVNGAQVNSETGNGAPIRDVNNQVLRIGKGSDVATPIEVWNGQLDEVRIWPFARSQADIMATMNVELSSVPGLVSTWNLNNDFLDSSSSQHATSSGQVTFVATPALTIPILPAALPGGASSPGCLGDMALAPSGPAFAGYLGFGVVCTRTPPGALTIWGASGQVLPGPLPLLGFDLWIDPSGAITLGGVADGLGAARVNIPVPLAVGPGFGFAIQCIVLDPCVPQLFTASDALTVITQ